MAIDNKVCPRSFLYSAIGLLLTEHILHIADILRHIGLDYAVRKWTSSALAPAFRPQEILLTLVDEPKIGHAIIQTVLINVLDQYATGRNTMSTMTH
jgi:hypothetical protein